MTRLNNYSQAPQAGGGGRGCFSRFLAAILILAVLLVVVGILGFNWYNSGITTPNSSDESTVSFEIKPGESSAQIGQNLQQQGLIKDLNIYSIYLRLSNKGSDIKAGKFLIAKNLTLEQVVNLISTNQKLTVAKVTLLEGWRATQMANKLEVEFQNDFPDKPTQVFQKSAYLDIVNKPDNQQFPEDVKAFLVKYKPAGKSLEGLLYPDTYEFEYDTTALEVISAQIKQFIAKTKVLELDANFYQDLVLASIIEKESFTNDERPLIASVFANRLKINMPLQSDATVNYATGNSNPRPTFQELATDSPYNTYKVTGLPPTPISNPRMESISAAINPASSKYYYFIHEQDGTGQVHFAETYAEHNENIRKYL